MEKKARIATLSAIALTVLAALVTLILLCRIPGWRRVGLKVNPESGLLAHFEQRMHDGKGEYTDAYATQFYYRYACGVPAKPATETEEATPAIEGQGPWFPVLSHATLWLWGGSLKWCLREAVTAAYWSAWAVLFWLMAVASWVTASLLRRLPAKEREPRVNSRGTLAERLLRWWRSDRKWRWPFARSKEPQVPRD